jgi:hypothetical protein
VTRRSFGRFPNLIHVALYESAEFDSRSKVIKLKHGADLILIAKHMSGRSASA